LLLGQAPEYLQDVSYGMPAFRGGNVATGGLGTLTPDTRMLDVATLPFVGAGAAKAGQLGAKTLGKEVARQVETGTGILGSNVLDPRQYATAYHGSPYIFDKFDINKVGAGTGVQSYGRGMYFTESPDVAKAYTSEYFDPTKLQNMPKGPNGIVQFNTIEDAMNALGTKSGALYKVDIPDQDIPKLLNWDVPIKDQPEIYSLIKNNIKDDDIRKTFENNAKSGITGSNAYLNYIGGKTDAEKSNNALQLGIKGIKYLDEASSKAGKGINNFVVFDPSEVKILEKGLLGK